MLEAAKELHGEIAHAEILEKGSMNSSAMTSADREQEYLDASESYITAIKPTAQQTATFCAATAQMLADDLGGRVEISLPEGIHIVRMPNTKQYGS
ncbi:hypothetical protein QFZ99_001414 [Paraburkholderia atlantica]|uniref:Uncharacterized protein n=2 Tax=Paraburkholderia atlantica TaxID=2654982 RepID=A0A7W8Q603_PARAM|nr:hypothetical protein [Paraburkholderia atlantica]MBB5415033.1 hypothetical protein [Paraburkholderia atlantica]MBB5423831.1 hypothetical protein [Paraburkholderia atlantica]